MVTSDGQRIAHVAQVGDLASEVKRYGKSISGSVLVRDRRKGDGSPEAVILAGGSERGESDVDER
jgi:hypothetical protein